MTAINPARLKIQCAELAQAFQQPARFVSGLHDLFGFYGARIRQTSLARTPLTLRTYQVPAPVFNALELELSESVMGSPAGAFSLLDALWKEEWYEFRHLAVILLGNISAGKPAEILKRVQAWRVSCPTEDIRRQIMTRGLRWMRTERPGQVLDFLKGLASSENKQDQQAALYGLQPFADDPHFDNFPAVLNVLRDILFIEETALVKEISALLASLQKRSDQETAYFLLRQLSAASKPRIFKVARQVLKFFSPESQAMLKEGLKTYK